MRMNTRHLLPPLALMASVIGAGCTSTPEPVDPLEAISSKAKAEQIVVVRPRGAECVTPERIRTFRGDAYCDTLHPVWGDGSKQGVISREDIRGTAPGQYGDGHMRSKHVATLTSKPVGVSKEEADAAMEDELLSAWQRYCDAGRGMTERDWALIEGRSIPEELDADCITPK